ncbi:MAG: NAD-dependent epimerase/dehydratase family protein [Thermoplasmatota archaeon]
MPRVLVTGASGFLGRPALDFLVRRGVEVHATSRVPPPGSADGVAWHDADLLKDRAAARLVDAIRPTHLLHLAWTAEPLVYWTSPQNPLWAEATRRLWRAFAAAGGKRAVGAGSCAEYDWSAGLCREGENERPASLYGRCKLEAARDVQAIADEADMGTAWGRVFHLHGPREHPKRFVSAVILALLAGRDAPMTHGRQLRDYLHAADVAAALGHLLLDASLDGPVNIGSGQAAELRHVASIIESIIGGPGRVRLDALPAPAGDPSRLVPDVRRLFGEAGWRPRFDLESGLRDSVDWWRRQQV